jgi:soluble lytic murein transglycosylase-like protein
MKARLFPSCGVGLRSALHALGCLPRLVGQNLPSLPDKKIRAFLVCSLLAFCAVPSLAAETQIPRAALQYRAQLTREARAVWGMDAPVSVFAAQIHTESWWRNDTVSSVGAQGLAQFMPSTAKWLPTVAPETGTPAPFNPAWSLRACVTYDRYLWERTDGVNAFERMAFTLSAYNGGAGWVNRDKKLARQRGLDPGRWFDSVATVNAGRSKAAWKENRNYPRLILQVRQYAYVKAGWGPGL